MNAGIQDAHNLGWKLAATLRGWAPDHLLDTYHTERHPIGAQLMEHSRAQTALMTGFTPEGLDLRSLFSGMIATQPALNKALSERLTALAVSYPTSDPPTALRPADRSRGSGPLAYEFEVWFKRNAVGGPITARAPDDMQLVQCSSALATCRATASPPGRAYRSSERTETGWERATGQTGCFSRCRCLALPPGPGCRRAGRARFRSRPPTPRRLDDVPSPPLADLVQSSPAGQPEGRGRPRPPGRQHRHSERSPSPRADAERPEARPHPQRSSRKRRPAHADAAVRHHRADRHALRHRRPLRTNRQAAQEACLVQPWRPASQSVSRRLTSSGRSCWIQWPQASRRWEADRPGRVVG